MSRIIVSMICAVAFSSAVSGCGTPTRQQVGIGAGTVVGGIGGSMATGGSTLGTVGGAAVGGLIGNTLSK